VILLQPGVVLGGFVLRLVQVVGEAAVYLLAGFLVAGVARAAIGPERLRRLGFPGAVAAAAALPLCALGVLPLLRVLAESRVRWSRLLPFALGAAALHPLALAFGLSYLGPRLFAMFLGLMLLALGALGLVGRWLDRGNRGGAPTDDGAVARRDRIRASFEEAARLASGPVWRDVAVGVVVAAATAALIDPMVINEEIFSGDRLALPRMAALGPSSYVTPEAGMAMVPEMLKFRQSPGAALAVLLVGVGITAGHVTLLARHGGARVAHAFLAACVLSVLGAGAVADAVIEPVGTPNVDNDHMAILANEGGDTWPAFVRHTGEALRGWVGASGVGLLGLSALSAYGHRRRRQPWAPRAVESDSSAAAGALQRPLPPGLVKVGTVLTLAVLGFAGLLAYFPAPGESFKDLSVIRADCFSELGAPDRATPLYHLALFERQLDRIEVGSWLRLGPPGPEARAALTRMREEVGTMRRGVQAGDLEAARVSFYRLNAAYRDGKTAFGLD
jgi:uncharacterized membrane protein YraQ (UPF0718 family)